MTDSMKKRLMGVVAVGVAMGALAWISTGSMGDNLVYYWSPTELLAADNAHSATVRLGGLVVPGTFDPGEGSGISFDVSDSTNTIHVESEGNPPQMFREGIGVVVEGKYGTDGVFRSDKVMVKHSNEYEAPEDGEEMNFEKTLADGEAAR